MPGKEEVKPLCVGLNTSDAELNNAAKLISFLSSEHDDEDAHIIALQGLTTFFVSTMKVQKTGVAGLDSEASVKFAGWLRKSYATFTSKVVSLSCDASVPEAVRLEAIQSLLECARSEKEGTLNNELYQEMLVALLGSGTFTDGVAGFLASLCEKFLDLRHYTYCAVRRLCDRTDAKEAGRIVGSCYQMLLGAPFSFLDTKEAPDSLVSWCRYVPPGAAPPGKKRKRVPEGDDAKLNVPKWAQGPVHRKAFSEAWLAFLRHELPLRQYKDVLVKLPTAVMPHMVNPLLLSDFLSKAVDVGDLIGVLALNGLFVLMAQHRLEYPQFYVRLYGLMEPGIFHSRHRKRIFELVDIFLRSTYLPGYLAAAFAKRLARLCLTAPPPGIMAAIAITHNLLRRHPGCIVLVHREGRSRAVEGADDSRRGGGADPESEAGETSRAVAENGGRRNAQQEQEDDRPSTAGKPSASQSAARRGDPYLAHEPDPAKSLAIHSSLWEFDAMRSHYCPEVARFVTVLEKDMSNRRTGTELDTAVLLENSFGSLFAAEANRRLKEVPLSLYTPSDAPTGLFASVSARSTALGGWADSWTT